MSLPDSSYASRRVLREPDYWKLRGSGCPWKPTNLKNVVVEDLLDGEDVSTRGLLEEGSFHPNGCSGCVLMPDEYIFGIRCDHLIWIAGWHEHIGLPHSDVEDFDESETDCVLLVANHKGFLRVALLYEVEDITVEEPYEIPLNE
jgi:hypothetical protein